MSHEESPEERPPRRLPVSGPLNQPNQPYPSQERDVDACNGQAVPGEGSQPKLVRAIRLTERDRQILILMTVLRVMDARQLQVHFTRLSPTKRTTLLRLQGVQKRLNELRDAGYIAVTSLNGRNLYSTTQEGAALVCPELAEDVPVDRHALHTLVSSTIVTQYVQSGFEVLAETQLRRAGTDSGYGVVSTEGKRHYPDAVALDGGWGRDIAIEVELTRKASYRYLHRFHAYRSGRYGKVHYWVLSEGMREVIQGYATRYGAEDLVQVRLIPDAARFFDLQDR